MKKKLVIIIVLIVCTLIGCEKVSHKFAIENIDMETYPRITDTLVLRELIYNNPEISGMEKYVSWWTDMYKNKNDSIYEAMKSFHTQKFNDFFWERINRDSLMQASIGKIRPIKELFHTRDSMTYRIIDTLSLKTHTGILVYLNSEERILKKLFLSIYDSKKELVGTYLVADRYEQPIDRKSVV